MVCRISVLVPLAVFCLLFVVFVCLFDCCWVGFLGGWGSLVQAVLGWFLLKYPNYAVGVLTIPYIWWGIK